MGPMKYRQYFAALASVLVMTLLGACGTSAPTRFYTLQTTENISVAPGSSARLTIAVGPFRFAEYLDRTQIVSRRDDSQLEIAEFDRWASPLPATFQRTIAANLATALDSDRVLEYPTSMPLVSGYRVSGRVSRFDTDSAGRAVLEVQWGIRDSDGNQLRDPARSRYTSSSSGTSYDARINAQSQALADFSQDIAGAIIELQDDEANPASP